jgi:GlcNAc-P-P-Und epimerase
MYENVLVTGGSGFIGTHLLQALALDDTVSRVVVFDLTPPHVHHPKVEYHYCDIREPLSVDLGTNCTLCYHLAALCKEPGYEWDSYFKTNHVGTSNLLTYLSREGIDNLVFTSTMMVYRAGEGRRAESSLTAPDTAYGMSKLLAEGEVRRWVACRAGRRGHIIRPGVVFGKWENGNFTRLYRAMKRGLFVYVGRADTVKGCVYIKDIVRALMFLAARPIELEVFNLVIPAPTTIADICRSMQNVFRLGDRTIPVVPFSLALAIGYMGEVLNGIGIQNSMHHRRIEKLWCSTHISPDAMLAAGFECAFDLPRALTDWRRACAPQDLF